MGSSVAACSVSTPSARAPIFLPALPRELVCKDGEKDCKPVCPYGVLIPDRDINQAEAEAYWRRDRASLKTCREVNKAIVSFYETLRHNLNPPED